MTVWGINAVRIAYALPCHIFDALPLIHAGREMRGETRNCEAAAAQRARADIKKREEALLCSVQWFSDCSDAVSPSLGSVVQWDRLNTEN